MCIYLHMYIYISIYITGVRVDSNSSACISVFSRNVAGVVGVSLDICAYLYIFISVYLYLLQAYGRIVTVPPVQVCSLEMSLALWVCSSDTLQSGTLVSWVWPHESAHLHRYICVT